MKHCCLLGVLCMLLLVPYPSQAGEKRYERSVVQYTIPDVTLINQERKEVKLRQLLKAGKPVLLDFIYGTCTTICPVLSAGFSNMQNKLGPDAAKVQFVSVSIDPEYDTPEVMRDYLDRYRAKPGWDFLTGTRKDIETVMRAFDAFVPNKMNHFPVTFLCMPGSDKWVRIYGMISTADLMAEYGNLQKEMSKP
ncbi:MAG: SCO family protein [Deltaproteobacteria bacterium]|nr:SCO family protein [Deltaproteobacteria bacterium]